MSKPKAIVLALTRLAAVVKATVNPGEFDIYADALEDVRPRVLELAFTHLEKHHTMPMLPAPGEIRDLGIRLREQECRQEEQAEYNARIARWKAEAQANPLSEEEKSELDASIKSTIARMDMQRSNAMNTRQAELLRSARINNLLQGVEFFLELKRVKRERDARAKAEQIAAR